MSMDLCWNFRCRYSYKKFHSSCSMSLGTCRVNARKKKRIFLVKAYTLSIQLLLQDREMTPDTGNVKQRSKSLFTSKDKFSCYTRGGKSVEAKKVM